MKISFKIFGYDLENLPIKQITFIEAKDYEVTDEVLTLKSKVKITKISDFDIRADSTTCGLEAYIEYVGKLENWLDQFCNYQVNGSRMPYDDYENILEWYDRRKRWIIEDIEI